jgi:hypothetical protein
MALLEAVNSPHERVRSYDVQNLINSLKLSKACGRDAIPYECLRHLRRDQGFVSIISSFFFSDVTFSSTLEGSESDKGTKTR